MASLEIHRIDRVPLSFFDEENIQGGLLGGGEHASYTVGVLAPGERQTHHLQRRPSDGVELILVYAGRFAVRSDSSEREVFDVGRDGPILIVCPSGVPASLESRDTEVRFFSVFAPPFAIGEIEFLE